MHVSEIYVYVLIRLLLKLAGENGRNRFLMEMASSTEVQVQGVDKLKEPCTNADD